MGGKSKAQQSKTLGERSKLNANRIEAVKQHIQLSKLVNRLQDYTLASPNEPDWEAKQLEPGQIASAKILIERLLPLTKHETIESTTNHTYSISDQVSDKITQLLSKAQEKVISAQVIETRQPITIDQTEQE